MRARASLALALALCAGLAAAEPGLGAVPREVMVTHTRVSVGDLIPNADAAIAAVDLGPAPAAGVSRLITRADIVAALQAKQVTSAAPLPDAVRVVRKVKHLAPPDVDALVRTAAASKDLGRGVTLATVRTNRTIDVADGWTRIDVDVPRAPKKAGTFSTIAIASLFAGDEVIARFPVSLDLSVSAEGAAFDAPRGSVVTLIVRRSFVEVRASGVAGADADVGETVPVQLRPSGRVVRARLVSRDEAVALEQGQ
jgi:flagella basal body P-ring formation protein FlgA